jgi:protein transport protein SEC61 subunit beta
MDRKELAKKSAIARSKQTPTRPSAAAQAGARPIARGNQLSFFNEEAQGLKLSPKTVLIISLLYLGIVVLLHIFGKVKGGAGAAAGAGGKDL